MNATTDPLCPLYRRYDGPIPRAQLDGVRAAAHPGGAKAHRVQKICARARLFDTLAQNAVQAMAHRRDAHPGTLPRDLIFYRTESLRLLDTLGR